MPTNIHAYAQMRDFAPKICDTKRQSRCAAPENMHFSMHCLREICVHMRKNVISHKTFVTPEGNLETQSRNAVP